MDEEGVKVCSVSHILLGGEDHNLPSQISKRRKSFYWVLPPFFPSSSVPVQRVCFSAWSSEVNSELMILKRLQDADHINRDTRKTQAPGSRCWGGLLIKMAVALKHCFLFFLCFFNVFSLLCCVLRSNRYSLNSHTPSFKSPFHCHAYKIMHNIIMK